MTDINLKDEIQKIKDKITHEWQTRWHNDPHGRRTYKFIKDVNYTSRHKWFIPGRYLVYILTGYGPINETLYKRGAIESPICKLCNESNENIEHMIFGCKRYENVRYTYLKNNNRDDLALLINTDENFQLFKGYIKEMFEIRNKLLE